MQLSGETEHEFTEAVRMLRSTCQHHPIAPSTQPCVPPPALSMHAWPPRTWREPQPKHVVSERRNDNAGVCMPTARADANSDGVNH